MEIFSLGIHEMLSFPDFSMQLSRFGAELLTLDHCRLIRCSRSIDHPHPIKRDKSSFLSTLCFASIESRMMRSPNMDQTVSGNETRLDSFPLLVASGCLGRPHAVQISLDLGLKGELDGG